jgi:hypothetical protein
MRWCLGSYRENTLSCSLAFSTNALLSWPISRGYHQSQVFVRADFQFQAVALKRVAVARATLRTYSAEEAFWIMAGIEILGQTLGMNRERAALRGDHGGFHLAVDDEFAAEHRAFRFVFRQVELRPHIGHYQLWSAMENVFSIWSLVEVFELEASLGGLEI